MTRLAQQAGSPVAPPGWAWLVFGVAVAVFVAADLLSHRREEEESRASAALWTAVWIAVGLGFMAFVWVSLGEVPAQEYLATYLLEKSLSLDNVFLFLVIFRALGIPGRYQRHILYWGILGAIVFRALFIFAGAAILERFDEMRYVLGAVLLYAAWRSGRVDPLGEEKAPVVSRLAERLRLSPRPHGGRLVTRVDGTWVATASAVALLAVETTDIMFAIDSVAAALAVTRNEFVLYTSNVFAILGLRALYVLLAETIAGLRYLHYGLALVLAFAGLKALAGEWVHVPPLVSVAVIVTIIGASILLSLRGRGGEPDAGEEDPRPAREEVAPEG